MEFIRAENLTFEYKKTEADGSEVVTRAIEDISFSIEKGSFTAIIGQNGSGKSTLAKNLNALLTPTKGTLMVDGLDTSDPQNLWPVRKKVAMVFQNPDNQIVSSIVEDDIAFGPENMGIDPEEIKERVTFALDSVEMEEYRKKAPHMLSGGQKQRIAIAGAVAMEPECIVFDEPTAMLDPRGSSDVLDVIKKLNDKGMTALLITHFMEEAAEADYIIVMDKGKIKLEGKPEDVFKQEELLKELSLGVPAPVELATLLRKRGIPLDENIMTTDDLVEELTR